MKNRYKIRVKVEFIETDEAITEEASNRDEYLEMVVDQAVAENIDDCEQALLQVNAKALRDALTKHLSEITKKNTRREQN